MASACSRLGRRWAQARMLRAGRAETRGARGGQPASACLWGGAAYARAQKGQRGPAESWRGAVRCAEVGARRGRGGWTRGVGVSLPRCADRRQRRTEGGGARVVPGVLVAAGWGAPESSAACVTWAPESDPFGQAGPSSIVAAFSGLCRGKELPLCQPSLGALSVPAE